MAVKFQILNLVVMFFIFVLTFCYSHGSPEVFFPIETPSPSLSDVPISTTLSSSLPTPEGLPDSQPPPQSPSSSSNDTNTSSIAKAVAATAACTIVIAGIFLFFVIRYAVARPQRERVGDSYQGGQPRVPPDEFVGINGNVKGLIVEENGLDVLYWRQLEGGANKNGFQKEILHSPKDEGGGMVRKERQSKKVEPVQAIPLFRGKSSTSHGHVPVPPAENDDSGELIGHLSPPPSLGIILKAVEKREATVQLKFLPAASIPPPQLPIPPPLLPIQDNGSSVTPKSPPPLNRNPATPSPPFQAISPAPPPPSPNKAGGSAAARDKSSTGETGESSGDGAADDNNQGKLKPLHLDKVNKNVDLSIVRDKINGGFDDDDLMEALFGSVATNRKSPTSNSSRNSKNTDSKH